MLDATAASASYVSNGEDYIITRDTLLSGYEMYLPSTESAHPEASPLWRDDFSGLPPCISSPPNMTRCVMKAKRCISEWLSKTWPVPVSAMLG
jgi:hypothetical protein